MKQSYRISRLLGSALRGASLVTSAWAAPAVDLQVDPGIFFVAPVGAQSFTATSDNIAGAGIYIDKRVAAIGDFDFTIGLYDGLPNAGGVQLASSSDTFTLASSGFFDVFWSRVSVTTGNTYYLVFDDGPTPLPIGSLVKQGQAYPDGTRYDIISGSYVARPDDISFRTWTEASAGQVPEPSSVYLAVTGLLTMIAVSRKHALRSKRPVR